MQSINFLFPIKYDFVDEIAEMYSFYSEPQAIGENNLFLTNELNKNLKPIIDTIEKQFNEKFNHFEFVENNCNLNLNLDKNKALVCFSGGKDSVYTALKLKERYDVTLYYLSGINTSYSDEINNAIECAKILNLPIIIEKVKVTGKTIFMENPLKNLVIYACALNYGLDKGINNYYFGNASQDLIEYSSFDRNFSDSLEMFNMFTTFINTTYNLNIINEPIINNYIDSIVELGKHKELYNSIKSCLSPIRYRANLKKHNEEKYKINLPKHNCGSCWKCCAEYIIWCDLKYVEYNEEFYKHCLGIIKNKIKDIKNNVDPKTLKELYICAFGEGLYDISHLKGQYND